MNKEGRDNNKHIDKSMITFIRILLIICITFNIIYNIQERARGLDDNFIIFV